MQVAHEASELAQQSGEVSLGIGVFDGIHLGHREIISRAVREARARDGRAIVATFDRHPETIIEPKHAPRLICSPEQKLKVIAELGADAVLLFQFDERFRAIPGDTFVRSLASDLRALRRIFVGSDFVFGHRRSGNVALLRQLGLELGFIVEPLAPVLFDGVPVSSTRIRKAIHAGDLALASELLGRPYAISGTVMRGDRLGAELGFPTANLDISDLVLPPGGVYSGCATVDGRRYTVVANLGSRPTLTGQAGAIRFEAHLVDFAGDLYGKELEVVLGKRLRDERRFGSLGELREQIAADLAQVRAQGG